MEPFLQEGEGESDREHIEVIDVVDIELLVLGAQAQAPDAKLGADAIGKVGSIIAATEAASAHRAIPTDEAAFREQIDWPDREETDREGRNAVRVDFDSIVLGLPEIDVVGFDRQPIERPDACDDFESRVIAIEIDGPFAD